jgi:hypothetical protein
MPHCQRLRGWRLAGGVPRIDLSKSSVTTQPSHNIILTFNPDEIPFQDGPNGLLSPLEIFSKRSDVLG